MSFIRNRAQWICNVGNGNDLHLQHLVRLVHPRQLRRGCVRACEEDAPTFYDQFLLKLDLLMDTRHILL